MGPVTDYDSFLPAVGGQFGVAIDATGSRAMVPALVLQELERRAGRPVAELFDLMVGSSTGGLLALLLACPTDTGRPRYAADELSEMLVRDLSPILGAPRTSRIGRALTKGNAHRESARLRDWLAERFGDARLRDALTRVIVGAYDLGARRIRFFDSSAAKENPSHDLPLATVANAALATLPFVDPVHVPDPQLKRDDLLVDGAFFGANPTFVALSTLFQESEQRPVLLSLGTGIRHDPLDFPDWADPKQMLSLLEAAQSGVADVAAALAERVLGQGNYLRLEPELDWREKPYADEGLDNPYGAESSASFSRMQDLGWRLVSERESDLNALAQSLLRPNAMPR